jgi:GPH family glycoside/pentoside/hexuronide:cation symporter
MRFRLPFGQILHEAMRSLAQQVFPLYNHNQGVIMTENRLTVRQKLVFGIFDLGGNMLFTLMSFWAFKYLTGTVGLAAGLPSLRGGPYVSGYGVFFTPPVYLPQPLHLAWAFLALMILNTASTVINIPYFSLTPELTSDYHEQSSLRRLLFILPPSSLHPV